MTYSNLGRLMAVYIVSHFGAFGLIKPRVNIQVKECSRKFKT